MSKDNLVPDPIWRRLRIFAIDPAVSAQFDTADIGEVTIAVPWEKLERSPEGKSIPVGEYGPIGEYVEVIDVDPAGGAAYKPVNLNDKKILAQNGLAPSESNPQFHQQMVYAVAMATIGHFERALGRVALWSSRKGRTPDGEYYEQFVRRLRIYPHALRDRNAYYSPEKKALLFGYFPVGVRDANNAPGTIVFTCLSHDIIAHETTHALLDGVHPRFNEPMNPDVLAFHEAFADIVAMFQHFSYPGLLRDQIARTRGDLRNESMLGQLAQQFGRASGRGEALRDALGKVNPDTDQWEATKPDVHALGRTTEPHARGAILVAAVFGAFLKVYRARTLDLYRIASDGTGVLREGDIHPDLANRLASEAAECARSTLQMCIRAIDYCPPVGITFGDYLRAIVTADADANPEDAYGFRLAFTESFRQWGITPIGLRSNSVESLLWPAGDDVMEEAALKLDRSDVEALFTQDQPYAPSLRQQSRSRWTDRMQRLEPWTLASDRKRTWEAVEHNAAILHAWLMHGTGRKMVRAFGLVLDDARPTVCHTGIGPERRPSVEVHSVRWALRRGPRGESFTDLVVEITQRRRGYLDPAVQRQKDAATQPESNDPSQTGTPKETSTDAERKEDEGDFKYRAGCTLLIDPRNMQVRRVIRTRGDINDDDELERMRKYLTGGLEPNNAFNAGYAALKVKEPFALLHRETEA